jgi:hypothetical protein
VTRVLRKFVRTNNGLPVLTVDGDPHVASILRAADPFWVFAALCEGCDDTDAF